jgi:hypothetical protein
MILNVMYPNSGFQFESFTGNFSSDALQQAKMRNLAYIAIMHTIDNQGG